MSDKIATVVRQAADNGGWAVIRLADGGEIGVRIERVEVAESDEQWEKRSLAAPFAPRQRAGDERRVGRVGASSEPVVGVGDVAGGRAVGDRRPPSSRRRHGSIPASEIVGQGSRHILLRASRLSSGGV